MAQITGGSVMFGRVVQPAQYESKKAEVTLTFAIGEGEGHAGMLDMVAKEARAKALELVGLKAPVGEPTPKAETEQASPAATAPAAGKPPKAAKTAKTEASPKVEHPKGEVTVEEVKQLISTDPENRAAPDDLDELADKPVTISDDAIEAAGHAKAKKIGEGGGSRVRVLRDKYTGTSHKTLRDIPQEKRAAFLKELETWS
jgi:hypothetical protein